jgi:hypothetical protein
LEEEMLTHRTKKPALNRWHRARALVAVDNAVVVADAVAGRLIRIALIVLLFMVGASILQAPPHRARPVAHAEAVRAIEGPLWKVPELTGAVDVVFVIDTTASMGEGLEAAKAQVREIVAQVNCQHPNVRVGAVAYRDKGDAYVVKEIPLSSDLDATASAIAELRAAGGGDIPEAVSSGLNHAVNQMPWSTDQKTTKLIYLIGDAAPQSDDGTVPWPVSVASAKSRGITVNTVLCDADADAETAWRAIAEAGGGAFSVVR